VRPFGVGSAGDHVRDLQRRLTATGFDPGPTDGQYGPRTAEAVRMFQSCRGLDLDGICGPQTWASLVEAGHRLGDRLLYLHAPMQRGDDVAEVQRRLGVLGFDAGRSDGILGPETAAAIEEFQRNVGLVPDGICGRETIVALRTLSDRLDQAHGVHALREQEELRGAPPTLAGWRVAVGEQGGLDVVTAAVRRVLVEQGAAVLTIHDPDWSRQARQANRYEAGVFLGVVLRQAESDVCFFATDGFESRPGRELACRLASHLAAVAAPVVRGMRLTVLRETRMPAVLCRFDQSRWVLPRTATLAREVSTALTAWIATDRAPAAV
jgi:N-acetylmuramoyl-L-alanine amidase